MHEELEVHKFGGSCLRDGTDLERIANILLEAEQPVILVVSALWGTTDRLMRAAQEPRYAGRLVYDLAKHHLRFSPTLVDSPLYDVFQRVLEGIEESLNALATDRDDRGAYNRLLASGERLSALVIAHGLSLRGLNAHPVGAEDIGLQLDGSGMATRVDLKASRAKLDRSAFHGVPVVTGWFGEGTDGDIALLGRGGSDHTATALAALLHAQRVVLWKDVLGIYPVNPRWGVQTSPIPYLGYGEAIEFANADATILHPATVEPVYEMGIPIEIRHLMSYKENGMKTVIGPDIEAEPSIKGIACIPRVACVNAEVRYSQDAAMALSDLLQALKEADVRICSFDTTNTQWRFVFRQHDVPKGVQIVQDHASSVSYDYYAAMLSFIGCRDIDYLHNLLETEDPENALLYESVACIHMLSQRVDISRMLDEIMTLISA
ncbi:MAG: hypothetical protein VW945_02010 [Candidatus Poseidoniales archaeon]|jgi:aspartate kinase